MEFSKQRSRERRFIKGLIRVNKKSQKLVESIISTSWVSVLRGFTNHPEEGDRSSIRLFAAAAEATAAYMKCSCSVESAPSRQLRESPSNYIAAETTSGGSSSQKLVLLV